MNLEQAIAEVNGIFIDVLDEEGIKLGKETTAKDVDGWDSLTHIQLVAAIEKHFKIRFTTGEIQGFSNVGEMCETIIAKLAKA